jgi:hypothetical protein
MKTDLILNCKKRPVTSLSARKASPSSSTSSLSTSTTNASSQKNKNLTNITNNMPTGGNNVARKIAWGKVQPAAHTQQQQQQQPSSISIHQKPELKVTSYFTEDTKSLVSSSASTSSDEYEDHDENEDESIGETTRMEFPTLSAAAKVLTETAPKSSTSSTQQQQANKVLNFAQVVAQRNPTGGGIVKQQRRKAHAKPTTFMDALREQSARIAKNSSLPDLKSMGHLWPVSTTTPTNAIQGEF